MREILFRGKTKNDDWVEGWFCGATCDDPDGDAYQSSQIIEKNSLFWVEVIPETVGQYTGLTDKNGTKIFEGDVMRFVSPDLEEPSAIRYVVEYIEDGFALRVAGRNLMEEFDGVPELYEIIGNIHDNPELVST